MRAILTFHSIDETGSIVSYTPAAFDKLLSTLLRKNIPILDLETVAKPETRTGVAITFDDGMQSVYKNALPILKQYNACAHVYVATSAVNNKELWPKNPVGIPSFKMLDWDEINELYKNNIYIENHTHTHPDMRTLTTEQIKEECETSDDIIKTHLGKAPEHFAYPFGYHNTGTRDFIRSRYKTAVTTELKPLGNRFDPAAVPRLDTYYLKSDWFINNIDSIIMQGYLAARNVLRNVKGSQNKANNK